MKLLCSDYISQRIPDTSSSLSKPFTSTFLSPSPMHHKIPGKVNQILQSVVAFISTFYKNSVPRKYFQISIKPRMLVGAQDPTLFCFNSCKQGAVLQNSPTPSISIRRKMIDMLQGIPFEIKLKSQR